MVCAIPTVILHALEGLNLETLHKTKTSLRYLHESRNHFTVYNDDDQGIERFDIIPEFLNKNGMRWKPELHNV
jgi:hypothetical protein